MESPTTRAANASGSATSGARTYSSATRAGYPKYEDRFNNLVNKFRTLKDGPAGPKLKP